MIVCPVIEPIKTKYKKLLRTALIKVKEYKYLVVAMELLLNDIDEYLSGGDSYEGVTTQSIIGIQLIFRGWIIKNWIDVNSN